MQDRCGLPSSVTVQAPHTPCSQPRCVPVRCRCSRRKSARWVRGSTNACSARPFTVRETDVSDMGVMPPPQPVRPRAVPPRPAMQAAPARGARRRHAPARARHRAARPKLHPQRSRSRPRRRPPQAGRRCAAGSIGAPPVAPQTTFEGEAVALIQHRRADGTGELAGLAADFAGSPSAHQPTGAALRSRRSVRRDRALWRTVLGRTSWPHSGARHRLPAQRSPRRGQPLLPANPLPDRRAPDCRQWSRGCARRGRRSRARRMGQQAVRRVLDRSVLDLGVRPAGCRGADRADPPPARAVRTRA